MSHIINTFIRFLCQDQEVVDEENKNHEFPEIHPTSSLVIKKVLEESVNRRLDKIERDEGWRERDWRMISFYFSFPIDSFQLITSLTLVL
jgi:hypothetical protein